MHAARPDVIFSPLRDSTRAQTVQSEEKQQRYVRGIAENSKKRKALMNDIDSAAIPMDDIFGTDDKKPGKDHPKYQNFQVKAKKYVDSLPFSQPTQGSSETMHTLARKRKQRHQQSLSLHMQSSFKNCEVWIQLLD